MKKRTAIIGALVSLLPMGQPLVIGGGVALTSAAAMLALPEQAMAESFRFYIDRGHKKHDAGDYSGAISDYSKAIEINPKYANTYYFRGGAKYLLQEDFYGVISDLNRYVELFSKEDEKAFMILGLAKKQLGDMKGACADWRKASSLGHKITPQWVRNQC